MHCNWQFLADTMERGMITDVWNWTAKYGNLAAVCMCMCVCVCVSLVCNVNGNCTAVLNLQYVLFTGIESYQATLSCWWQSMIALSNTFVYAVVFTFTVLWHMYLVNKLLVMHCMLPAEYASEKILKFCQHLTKIWTYPWRHHCIDLRFSVLNFEPLLCKNAPTPSCSSCVFMKSYMCCVRKTPAAIPPMG